MEDITTIKLVPVFITVVLFIGGIVLSIWSKVSFARKRDIYNDDGTTKFPVIAVCDKNHRHTCQALNKIESKLDDMDRRRTETRSEWTDAIRALTHDVGVLQGKVETLTKQ